MARGTVSVHPLLGESGPDSGPGIGPATEAKVRLTGRGVLVQEVADLRKESAVLKHWVSFADTAVAGCVEGLKTKRFRCSEAFCKVGP